MSDVEMLLEPELQKQDQETRPLLELLREKALLVALRISWWKGQRAMDEDATVTLGEIAVDSGVRTRPQWRLCPLTWAERCRKIECQARTALRRRSVRFGIDGVSVLPVDRADEVCAELRECRDLLQQEAERAVASYDELIVWVREQAGAAWEKAADAIPSRTRLYDFYGMDWPVVPIGGVESLDSQVASGYVTESKRMLGEVVRRTVDRMVTEPRRELAEAVENLEARLRDGGVVRGGTLDRIRRAVEKLRGFAFVADDSLLFRLETLEQGTLSMTPKELNTSAASVAIAAELQMLRQDIEGEDKTYRTYRRLPRGIAV